MASKYSFFTGIIYPDSAPDDWHERLVNSLNMYLVSPLHDPDERDSDEDVAMETTKPHYHLLYCHGNPISPKSARTVYPFEESWCFSNPNPVKFGVSAATNLARYFLHLDQPKKQQWEGDPYEILDVLNGYPLDLSRQLTRREKRDMRIGIQDTLHKLNIYELGGAIDYFRNAQMWEEYDFANDNYGWLKAWCDSHRNHNKEEEKRALEPDNAAKQQRAMMDAHLREEAERYDEAVERGDIEQH